MANTSIKLDIYVNYPGHCEKAFRFYEQYLGGKITMITPHQQLPPNFPKEWENPILHARIEIGGLTLMGADIPNAEPMRSAYLTIRCDTPKKAEDIYNLLAQDGQIFMKWRRPFSQIALAFYGINSELPGCCSMKINTLY